MEDLVKIINALNLPKDVLDKAERLFYEFFGKSISEYSLLMQDNIRMRRFKNQIKIFAKAADLIEKSNIKTKEISLKVLVPLIDNLSLEENETLQQKWANLLSNIVSENESESLTKLFIEILSRLSVSEVVLLDHLYENMIKDFERRGINEKEMLDGFSNDKIKTSACQFYLSDIKKVSIPTTSLEILITQGLLKWKSPTITKQKSFNSLMHHSSVGALIAGQTDYKLKESKSFYFSNIGIKFVIACKFGE